ncbi:hypothetical protein ACRPM7_02965 [Burkholderia vietnamiensis]|uniref:hypothetical protein n=1 Tax=Burkholderia vietnamiensis TaxID=60552 RepID=UPI0007590C0A|nr:hypothetical protein [Burkholderia vietnamiensis]KVR90033.1 hypothetical protein WK28_23585 [Burkholderia vietnamiensis]QTK88693.1 hypothetical protein J4D21_26070 [Burkholderia vietnamiensis]
MKDEIKRALATMLAPYHGVFHALRVSDDMDRRVIEVKGKSKAEDQHGFLMLRVVVLDDDRQVLIPNIIKPEPLTERGFGRRLIATVYEVAKAGGYDLFIVDMVPSFHRRMLEWGAALVDEETVQVTDATLLVQPAAPAA